MPVWSSLAVEQMITSSAYVYSCSYYFFLRSVT